MAAEDWIDLCYDEWDVTTGKSGRHYSPDVSNPQDVWDDGHHCGGVPTLRANRTTGERFWGCSKFPRCRHTIPYEDGDLLWGKP